MRARFNVVAAVVLVVAALVSPGCAAVTAAAETLAAIGAAETFDDLAGLWEAVSGAPNVLRVIYQQEIEFRWLWLLAVGQGWEPVE